MIRWFALQWGRRKSERGGIGKMSWWLGLFSFDFLSKRCQNGRVLGGWPLGVFVSFWVSLKILNSEFFVCIAGERMNGVMSRWWGDDEMR